VAGVWPLRIPGNERASGSSWSQRSSRCAAGPAPSGADLLHHAHDFRELDELRSLVSSQRILFEERKDAARQILEGPDGPSMHVPPVVVMPAIDTDTPTPEVVLQLVQYVRTWRRLARRRTQAGTASPASPKAAEIGTEKQPSPSTNPTIHCSNPGLSC
jgi:hypothetical protein